MKQVVVVAALLAVLFVTACGGLPGVSNAAATPTKAPTALPTSIPTQAPSPTAAPTATPTSLPTPTVGNPLDVLSKAFKGMAGVKAFRAQKTTTGLPGGGIQPETIEVVLPDRYHLINKQTELIMIGKTVYLKAGTKWQKMALPPGIDLSIADPKKLESYLGASTGFKLVGTDDVDGTATIVFQYTTTLKGPPAQKFTTKLWVGAADGLPRKSESEPKPGQKTTILYTDYNGNIVINAPI